MTLEETLLWMRAVARQRNLADGDDWYFFQLWWWDLFDVHKTQLLELLLPITSKK